MSLAIAEFPHSAASPRADRRGTSIWTRHGLWPLLIVAIGAAPRLMFLTHAPPGLNQDEAANAWNAWCLLQTGQDQAGVRWPIFYTRGLGENRSTLFIYLMMPFQALGGLNVLTTRLPSAVYGILTLPLLYYVGARLFGRVTGLMAAALLAVSPWHIQQCRWGHEAAIVPFLVVAPLALMLWARLPLIHRAATVQPDDTLDTPRAKPASPPRCPPRSGVRRVKGQPAELARPRVVLSLLAGAVVGICCYGYPAVRLFLPAFLTVATLLNLRGWWHFARAPRGLAALGAFGVGVALTFGPLLWTHVTDAESINKRGDTNPLWHEDDPWARRLELFGKRYYGHFDTSFLFYEGDGYKIQTPPEMGQFDHYLFPLMLLGTIELIRRLWRWPAARLLAAWIVAYPAGDLIFAADGIHALRSLPGLCGLLLLAGLGAATGASWLRRPARTYALVAAVVSVVVINARFYLQFFGEFNRIGPVYHGFHADLVSACDWLRPRLDEVDAVFITTTNMNMPYIVTLVGLEYDPRAWLSGGRAISQSRNWDTYTQYGKVRFLYNTTADNALAPLQSNGRTDRTIVIVRPGESSLQGPAHVVYGPDGNEELLIFDEGL